MPQAPWKDWVAGVRVSPDGTRFFRARFHRSRTIKWRWEFVDRQVGPIPCCPECGATVPKGRPQARHEGEHNKLYDLLEKIVYEVFGTEPETDDDDGQLQLESGEDNGTVQQ